MMRLPEVLLLDGNHAPLFKYRGVPAFSRSPPSFSGTTPFGHALLTFVGIGTGVNSTTVASVGVQIRPPSSAGL